MMQGSIILQCQVHIVYPGMQRIYRDSMRDIDDLYVRKQRRQQLFCFCRSIGLRQSVTGHLYRIVRNKSLHPALYRPLHQLARGPVLL